MARDDEASMKCSPLVRLGRHCDWPLLGVETATGPFLNVILSYITGKDP
jgi:hypothetical protein